MLCQDANPSIIDRVLQGVKKRSSAAVRVAVARSFERLEDLLGLAETDVILQSVLIVACAESGDWQLAISSLRTMRMDALEPDHVSHSCALNSGEYNIVQPCTAS